MASVALGNRGHLIPAVLVPTGTTETVNWEKGIRQIIDLESATGNVTLTLNDPKQGGVENNRAAKRGEHDP